MSRSHIRRDVGGRATTAALALFAATVSTAPRPSAALSTWGVLPHKERFVAYVGKFCFDYKGDMEMIGRIEITVTGKVRNGAPEERLPERRLQEGRPGGGSPSDKEVQGRLWFMMFDDEQKHWENANRNWHTASCSELKAFSSSAEAISPVDGRMNLTLGVREHIRPRFWYFGFVACGIDFDDDKYPIAYEIHAENIMLGFESEFSMDEHGSLQLQLAFTLMFGFLTCQICTTGGGASSSRPLLRIVALSSKLSTVGCACLAAHFLAYATNGYGLAALEIFGVVFASLAKGVLGTLQILAAKGWALVYSPDEMGPRRAVAAAIGVIILVSVGCEIHGHYFNDRSTILYLYESTPGLLILFANVLLFMEAWTSMKITYSREQSEELRTFYTTISLASLVYFLAVPTMCIVAALLAPHVRRKYVDRAELFSRFVATALLSWSLRPSRLDAVLNARMELDCFRPSEEIELQESQESHDQVSEE